MRRSAGLACGARPFQRHVLPGVPSFLILAPLFVSCPFGFLTFDTSRVSGACLPPPSPPLSPPGLFRAPEPFPWAWMAASPFAAASAGDGPSRRVFSPLGAFFFSGAAQFSLLGTDGVSEHRLRVESKKEGRRPLLERRPFSCRLEDYRNILGLTTETRSRLSRSPSG